jgi:cytosine/adenosine deaminase-related metal-dependent hydrolase
MTSAFSADWVLPVDGDPVEEGAVVWEDDTITAVGPRAELGEGERFDGAAIVPAFVNAHSHLEYAVYAGFGDGQPFGPWLATHIERKGRIAWEEFLAIAHLGAAECLRSGIGTVGDASFSGAAAHAAEELGLRASVYLEVFGTDPDEAAERLDELLARADAGEGARLGVSPHAPYSVSPDVYRMTYARGLPVATHVAESDDELDYLLQGEGPIATVSEVDPPGTTPVRHLAREGLLEPRVVAAHCVKVDEEEIELLARHDVGVAHCPRSNALLGCGIAPLRALLDAGVRVGLGTDSPASTPSFDVFDEMRAAVYAARARAERPDALSGEEALELATLGGARALGLGDEVGSLAPGKRADLAVVSLAGSPYLPGEDPAAAVVFGGSPERVLVTVVDGEERYRKGGMAWHELRHAAAEARRRLLGARPLAQKT